MKPNKNFSRARNLYFQVSYNFKYSHPNFESSGSIIFGHLIDIFSEEIPSTDLTQYAYLYAAYVCRLAVPRKSVEYFPQPL
jgi:hypothetical protein